MSNLDDAELIDELRAGLADRTAHLHAPADLPGSARRLARRRATLRIAAGAATGLGLTGLLVGLLAGAGGAPAHLAAPLRTAPPAARNQDTAYIVSRVRARLTADLRSAVPTAEQSADYTRARVSADGSVIDLGRRTSEVGSYTAPDGAQYFHYVQLGRGGEPKLISFVVIGPVRDGRQPYFARDLDPVTRTWAQSRSDTPVSRLGQGRGPAYLSPGLSSSAAAVRQSLRSGRVTRLGTPVLHGMATVALSITTPGYRNILYVDARSYRPLGQAYVPDPGNDGPDTGVTISFFRAPTRAAVDAAREDRIPAGYTPAAGSR